MTSMAPLVIRFGSLGDMVLLTGLLHSLHRRFGRPCDLLSSTVWPEALLARHPDLGETYRIGSRRRPYWSDPQQWRLVRWLRNRPPGPVYVCDDRALRKLRFLLVRAGTDPSRCVFYDHAGHEPQAHWFERLSVLAARTPPAYAGTPPLPAAERPTHPRLFVSAAARADLTCWRAERGLDGPLVLVQPGNKRTLRHGGLRRADHHKWWPPERWAEVVRAVLGDRPDVRVVLCGVPAEQPLLRRVADLTADPRVFACGEELPLPRLMALTEVAQAMIAVDSGPAHIAAALACPSVVLFGAAPPWLWRPLAPEGVPVIAVGGEPAGLDRVDRIPVVEVIAAWRRLPVHRDLNRAATVAS